jgi:hypothetical protein
MSIIIAEPEDYGRGRIERWRGWSVPALEWSTGVDQWRDLKSLISIESAGRQRSVHVLGIENSLHWALDVVFREDDPGVGIRTAAEKIENQWSHHRDS